MAPASSSNSNNKPALAVIESMAFESRAFDTPLEADRVTDADAGLFSSLLRAPVAGVLWLLGGENDDAKREEEMRRRENERIEREILGDLGVGVEKGENDDDDDSCVDDDGDPPGVSTAASSQHCDQADIDEGGKEDEQSSLQKLPCVGDSSPLNDASNYCEGGPRDGDAAAKENTHENTAMPPPSSGQSAESGTQSSDDAISCPASQMIDDLVPVMENSNITDEAGNSSLGPATSAVLSSQSKMTSSSTASLSASYSASTFSNHQHISQSQGLHSSFNIGNSTSNPSIRGNKKMSWSDECGNRSLVEYFDDSSRSGHWSSMRRNSWRASRPHSDDGLDKGCGSRRGEVGVIKSALRSGSYSPPIAFYASNSTGVPGSASSSTESSSASLSPGGMKSFRSLSVIGSSDSSMSRESDTSDSVAAVTNKKLNANDVQCVPSTLHAGSGRANGGLIIPRGGPTDTRYYFPRGGPNDPRYQLILGTGAVAPEQQEAESGNEQGEQGEKNEQEEDVANAKAGSSSILSSAPITGGKVSPGHHHHFLPRSTGYVSPQYGFYVNLTPPTPEFHAAARIPGDKRSVIQQPQSYQQFQYQNKYQAPSPIPEGKALNQRFVGTSSVPRPSSKKTSSEERDKRQSSMKSTFTKNKKGMGNYGLMAENPHHGAWPTVPFG